MYDISQSSCVVFTSRACISEVLNVIFIEVIVRVQIFYSKVLQGSHVFCLSNCICVLGHVNSCRVLMCV